MSVLQFPDRGGIGWRTEAKTWGEVDPTNLHHAAQAYWAKGGPLPPLDTPGETWAHENARAPAVDGDHQLVAPPAIRRGMANGGCGAVGVALSGGCRRVPGHPPSCADAHAREEAMRSANKPPKSLSDRLARTSALLGTAEAILQLAGIRSPKTKSKAARSTAPITLWCP